MGLFCWLSRRGTESGSRRPARTGGTAPPPRLGRPALEVLEERCLLSAELEALQGGFQPGTGPRWEARQQEILAGRGADPAVVFMGDSIVDYYANGLGTDSWQSRM